MQARIGFAIAFVALLIILQARIGFAIAFGALLIILVVLAGAYMVGAH